MIVILTANMAGGFKFLAAQKTRGRYDRFGPFVESAGFPLKLPELDGVTFR
jgi:hypothetical protein